MDNTFRPRTPGRRSVAAGLLGTLAIGASLFFHVPPSGAAAPCAVSYTVGAFWGGFQAQLVITPGDAVTSWTVDFDVAD